jgi:DNA-directed RNA polymerase subunit K/omega
MKLTRYEKARIIGARALQISMGALLILKLGKEDLEELKFDPIKIAERELSEDILPITIKRPMP